MSKTLSTSVAFTDAQNNVLAKGTIIFQLNMGARLITNGQIVNAVKISFTLTSTGMMPAASVIDANDELQPTGTFYVVTVFNSNGLLVRGPENWILSGASPIDLSTITSSSVPDPGLANPIIGNPSAPQTITGQPLTLTPTAPFIVQGTGTFTGGLSGDSINNQLVVGPSPFRYQTIAAAQTALPAAGGTIFVRNDATLDASTITITKPIHVIFDAGSYSSAATGSLFACTTGVEGVHIEGSNRGGAGITQGTVISLTNNACIGFNFTNAPGALIERLTLLGPNTGGTGKGIILSGTRPTLRQLLVSQFGSDGVTIDGTTNNTNLAEVDHVRAQNNSGHGFKTLGSNANVILFNGADAGGNIGDGFNIATSGNAFIGTNTSGNGTGGVGNGYHFLSGANNNWGFTFSDAPNGNENTGYRWDSGANFNLIFTTADAGAAPVVNNGSGNRYVSASSTMNQWNAVGFGAGDGLVGSPSYGFTSETNSGRYRNGVSSYIDAIAGGDVLRYQTTGITVASTMSLMFGGSGVGATDTGLSRTAAGSVAVGNGTQGNTSGTLLLTTNRFVEAAAPSGVAGSDLLWGDSTTHTPSWNNNNKGTSSPSGAWAAANVTPVTVNANVSTDQNLMSISVPAGTLNRVGRTLRIWLAGVYSTPAASTTAVVVKVNLGALTLATWTTTALAGIQATNDQFNLTAWSTTQTAGATAAFEVHGNLDIDLGVGNTVADSNFADVNTATVSSVDLTAAQTLQVTIAFTVASASNSATQRQLILETIG